MSVKSSCAKWLLVTVWMRLGTWELSTATWTAEMCSLQRFRCARAAAFGSVFTQSENEKFPENTMFFFAVLNMEVSRCCLPWSVQCHAGDNPQGFTLWMCVCSSVFPVLSCIFSCCLLLDSPPPCFSSLNNTSVRCSPRTRAREEERERRGDTKKE